jgi:NTP pyrophosphatase (non-canonical NTP hydrolase)
MLKGYKGEKRMSFEELMFEINKDVFSERVRQNEKWGNQRHTYGSWLAILVEEVGEAAQAMQVHWGWGKPSDAQNLYEELIHVAAVASAIAEQVREESEEQATFTKA